MRIIGGTARRTALETPGSGMRPTTDRVRESLFAVLMPRLPDCRFLDLFAGSGAVGLEALSRGASRVVSVEMDERAMAAIRQNAARAHLADHLRIVGGDAFGVLGSLGELFDVVYADPPYRKHPTDPDHVGKLLAHPGLPAILDPEGVLILEAPTRDFFPDAVGPWLRDQSRRYGRTALHFYRLAAGAR